MSALIPCSRAGWRRVSRSKAWLVVTRTKRSPFRGSGGGGPSRVNLGDCFAYALSKATSEPLLFKDDFGGADAQTAAFGPGADRHGRDDMRRLSRPPCTAAPTGQGSRCLFIPSPSEPADVADNLQSKNEIRRGKGVLSVQVDLEFGRLIAVDAALNDRVPVTDRGT